MQEKEAADQEAAARVGAADAERARLEGELAERSEAHARAIAAVEAERADERARAEAQRAETEEAHGRALEEVRAELERERTESGAKLALAEERITALDVERDRLLADVKRLEADAAEKDEATEAARRQADEELAALRAKLDEAEGRAQAISGELGEARERVEALEQELRTATEQRDATAGELRAARGEAKAYEEKALAAEHAWQAKAAELGAAEQRVRDLSAALNEGRATAEGNRGELGRIEGLRADAERRAAMASAERDQLSREVDSARRDAEAAREEQRADRARVQKLEGEVARLGRLEPVAEEAARLRKEVASLRDIIQQRTSSAESSSRQAQTAAAERARLEERLAVESGKLQAQVARLESELGATRRRADELDKVLLQRDAALKKAGAELEDRRRAQVGGSADAEKKHTAEVARLKGAMIELEKHLEARARSEMQLKKRVQELEKGGRPAAPEPVDVARMRAQLGKLAEELDELKGENEFLNGEVARYVQKNKELAAQLAALRA
jgi:chromosome segregation ATPase